MKVISVVSDAKPALLKVGDIVEYTNGDPHAIITKVYKRHNDFIRPAVANIDQAFIVTSVKEPDINLNLLDRMITIFEFQEITPILIFSKIDLLKDDEKEKTLQIPLSGSGTAHESAF